MRVYIKDSKGQEVIVDGLSGSTKVRELKEKIKNITQMRDYPELAFGGSNLEDEDTLDDYDIQECNNIICYQTFLAGLNK